MSKEAMKPKTPKTPLPAHLWVRGRNGQPVCQCGRGHGSSFDGLCYTCRGGVTAWDARNKPYRQLQDNGSKYFGESWDKAEQPPPRKPLIDERMIAQAVAAEREACAKVAWEMKGQCWAYDHDTIAAAIRARGAAKLRSKNI